MARNPWVRVHAPWFVHEDDRDADTVLGLRYRYVRDDYAGECDACREGVCIQRQMMSDAWLGVVTGHLGDDPMFWN